MPADVSGKKRKKEIYLPQQYQYQTRKTQY